MRSELRILLVLVALAPVVSACHRPRDVVAPAGKGTMPAGSIAHWDPAKRRFTEPTPDAVANMAAAAGRAAPQPALREEDSPRGGKMVRLGERFHHHVTAAVQGATVTNACSPEARDVKGP